MKSQQLEIKTTCENCSFAIVNNGKQTGCKANRLDKFIEQKKAFKSENGWFILDRFCNMLRKEKISIEDAYNKIKCNFGIAIFDQDEKYSDLAIESCKNIQYDKDKFKISIYSNNNQRFSRLFSEVNELKKNGIEANLFFDINKNDLSTSETEVFKYLHKCSHVLKLKSDDSIDPLFLSNINESLNDNLDVFFTYQSKNIYCAPFWIVNQHYLNYNSYDLTLEAIVKESVENSMHKIYA